MNYESIIESMTRVLAKSIASYIADLAIDVVDRLYSWMPPEQYRKERLVVEGYYRTLLRSPAILRSNPAAYGREHKSRYYINGRRR